MNARRQVAAVALCCIAMQPALRSAPAAAQASETEAGDPDAYPVVIRVSESLFASPEPEVREVTPVDTCVLGVRSVGTASVLGELTPEFFTSSKGVRMDLVLEGTSTAKTTARQGPALVHTTTTCRFTACAPLTFHHEVGFSAGEITATVNGVDQRRRVNSTTPGLRGRLVRRVANRRISQQQDQIMRIAESNTRSRLVSSMERRVSERLSAWNEHWLKLQAALKQQRWYPEAPRLFLTTTPNHLIAFVASTRDRAVPTVEEIRLPTPTADAVIEIFVRAEPAELRSADNLLLNYLAATPQQLLLLFENAALAVSYEKISGWRAFRIKAKTLANTPITPGGSETQ